MREIAFTLTARVTDWPDGGAVPTTVTVARYSAGNCVFDRDMTRADVLKVFGGTLNIVATNLDKAVDGALAMVDVDAPPLCEPAPAALAETSAT